jgi:hypothetical protein
MRQSGLRQFVWVVVIVAPGYGGGCEFAEWATTTEDRIDPRTGEKIPGTTPAEDWLTDSTGGLNGFGEGGIVAGIVALVFTTTKSTIRMINRYRASKKFVDTVETFGVSSNAEGTPIPTAAGPTAAVTPVTAPLVGLPAVAAKAARKRRRK